MAEILKELKLSHCQIWAGIRYVKKELKKRGVGKCKIFPGLDSLLAYLSKRYVLGVISTNSKENINALLHNNNLNRYFSFLYADSPLLGKDKTIKRVLRKEKIKKGQVIYIGDEKRDITACKKAGIPIIPVTWGYNSKKCLMQETPEYLADKPEDIKLILERMGF